MSDSPLVSVVIPAYNAGCYLAETLDSLRAQTLTDWEAIVVDDGSTDDTLAIVERFAGIDSRIRVLSQGNQGISVARNTAIAAARAEAIALLDSDDLWRPEKLEMQLACLREQKVDMTFSDYTYCDANGAPKGGRRSGLTGLFTGNEFFRLCYSGFFLLPSAVMLRTETLRRFQGFDPSLQRNEDLDLWLRLSAGGCRFYGLSEPLLTYRKHAASVSSQGLFEATATMLPRYAASHLICDVERPKPFRLMFRNNFTLLERLGEIDRGKRLFDLYYPFDRANGACRLMKVLRHLLPDYLFWFVCRFAVIPLAWHAERFWERVGRYYIASSLPGDR